MPRESAGAMTTGELALAAAVALVAATAAPPPPQQAKEEALTIAELAKANRVAVAAVAVALTALAS